MAKRTQVLGRFGFAKLVAGIAQSVVDRNKQPEPLWATVTARDEDGRPTVAIDGGETITCHSWAAEAYEGNRVTVEVRNHKVRLLTNETRPATDDAAAEEALEAIDGLEEETLPAMASSIAAARSAANEAQNTANATNQYFFHDGSGAHVTTDSNKAAGTFNTLWNTSGLLFRAALNNLVSLTKSALAFYDGEGNADTNIVALFGKAMARIGKLSSSHVVASSDGYVDVNFGNTTMAHFGYGAGKAPSNLYEDAPYYTLGQREPDGAIGNYSTVEGLWGTASGAYSHAEGGTCTASGHRAHAEGHETTASGDDSHAEGTVTEATARSSHAEGYFTKASGDYQHVSGRFNVEDTESKYAEIVGGGWATGRKNIRTLDWNGNATYAGNVTDGSGNVLSSKTDTGHKHSATDVNSGTFAVARIPTLTIAKLPSIFKTITGSKAYTCDSGKQEEVTVSLSPGANYVPVAVARIATGHAACVIRTFVIDIDDNQIRVFIRNIVDDSVSGSVHVTMLCVPIALMV